MAWREEGEQFKIEGLGVPDADLPDIIVLIGVSSRKDIVRGDPDGDESTRTLRAEGVEGAWSMELSKRRYLRVRVKV